MAVKYIISVWASGKVSSLAPPPGIRFAGQERTQIQQVRECYPSNGGSGKEHSPNEAGSQTARRQYGKGQNTERSPGGRKNSRRMQIEFADCKLAAEVSEGPNDAGRLIRCEPITRHRATEGARRRATASDRGTSTESCDNPEQLEVQL